MPAADTEPSARLCAMGRRSATRLMQQAFLVHVEDGAITRVPTIPCPKA
ncbi:hypothetical protein DB30_03967 [Enhygromyxa salina]|uniref:Uncharacterized protein n=1 Tax=Enhygromyxa salina TaxID=215803 RepID=A0A0C2CP39_9BACT|nr:hypothetical protein DB30_03968 [Enhygromyxa salina]KIG11510.1 hypothetical protein DB30_03967 [Enhygromyxa salina]